MGTCRRGSRQRHAAQGWEARWWLLSSRPLSRCLAAELFWRKSRADTVHPARVTLETLNDVSSAVIQIENSRSAAGQPRQGKRERHAAQGWEARWWLLSSRPLSRCLAAELSGTHHPARVV